MLSVGSQEIHISLRMTGMCQRWTFKSDAELTSFLDAEIHPLRGHRENSDLSFTEHERPLADLDAERS